MSANWHILGSCRIFSALKGVLPRTFLGLVGTWITLGPIALLFGSQSAPWTLMTVSVLSLVLCYTGVIFACIRFRWPTLRELISETGWAMCFIVIGELASEMTGVFNTHKFKMAPVYAVMGYFIAELVKPNVPLEVLGKKLEEWFHHCLNDSR